VSNTQPTFTLTTKHIAFYRRYGFLVIPNCIPRELTDPLRAEIKEKLWDIAKINTDDLLSSTSEQWSKVSGKFGGMLEIFFLKGQEKIREHPNPYWAIVQLFENTWFAENNKEIGFDHPFKDLNPRHLWVYVDRMNFRLPKKIMENIEVGDF